MAVALATSIANGQCSTGGFAIAHIILQGCVVLIPLQKLSGHKICQQIGGQILSEIVENTSDSILISDISEQPCTGYLITGKVPKKIASACAVIDTL